MQDNLCFLDAGQLAEGYKHEDFSPVDVVDAYLQRIATLNPKLHAYLDVFAEAARQDAQQSAKRIAEGQARRLEGIPIALKDLLEIEGKVCTAGSMTRHDTIATRTATIASKLESLGAIVLGKVHTVEFAFGGWGTNQRMGTPWNPWSETVHLTPGGSSSGSGVAVAGRLAPWAIGTDTGGSVRVPAAFNDIVGLKTTYGRISTYGISPLSPSLDTPGVMTRTVADAAVLFDALQGYDPKDVATRGLPPVDVFSELNLGVTGLRLGRIPESDRAGIDPEVLAAYDASLATFESLGAQIVQATLPDSLVSYAGKSAQMAAEAYALHGDVAEDPTSLMDEAVRKRVLSGNLPAATYLRAKAELVQDAEAFIAALDGIDALIVPTTQTPPIPVASVNETTTAAMLTRFANQLALCGLAVPCGYTLGGLPLSIQIVCRPYGEALALRVGQAYEVATIAQRRLPPVA